MAISITRKYLYFRWLAPDLTLSVANAPWLSKVLKITGLTTPSSTGVNNRTNYTGAYNGLTPGGTLQKLVQNGEYELVSGVFDGWSLPTSIEVFNLVLTSSSPSPSISGISPTSGAVGSVVTITGTNFGASAGATGVVKFNGLLAYPTAWSATSITVPVPTGATTGVVTVTTSAGTATSPVFTLTSAGVAPDAPVVEVNVANRTLAITLAAGTTVADYEIDYGNTGSLVGPTVIANVAARTLELTLEPGTTVDDYEIQF